MAAGREVGGKGNKGQQFGFSLTRANDDDESDFHRYSGLVVFQRYASVMLLYASVETGAVLVLVGRVFKSSLS